MFVKVLPAFIAAITLAAPAHAQESTEPSGDAAPAPEAQPEPAMGTITAEMIEDATIVSLQGQYNEDVWNGSTPLGTLVADLTEIGEVEDIVLSPDGQVQGLTTDVGGFLGIGQKEVMIPLDDIRLTRAPDTDDITVITRMSDQALEDAPEFDIDD